MKYRVMQALAALLAFALISTAFYMPSPEAAPEPTPVDGTKTAALALGQWPWLRQILLLGEIPLSTAESIALMRKDCTIIWCPTRATDETRAFAAQREKVPILAKTTRHVGTNPIDFIYQLDPGRDDVIIIAPPPLHTHAGIAWLREGPLQAIRRITQSNSPVFFFLNMPEGPLSPAEARVLAATLAALRQVFPENEMIAAGAGGWWIGARTPNRLNGEAASKKSLALLKQTLFPIEGMPQLWRSDLLQTWINDAPFIARDSSADAPPIEPDLAALQRQAWIAHLEKKPFWSVFTPCIEFFHDSPTRFPFFFLISAAGILAAIAFGGAFKTIETRFSFAWQAACGGILATLALMLNAQLTSRIMLKLIVLLFFITLLYAAKKFKRITFFPMAPLAGCAFFYPAYALLTFCFFPASTVFFCLLALATGTSLLTLGRREPLWALIPAALGLIAAMLNIYRINS